MNNSENNHIRASVALTTNGDINFYLDDYAVSDELFTEYQKLVNAKEEDIDCELDGDLMDELEDILGIDFNDSENEYMYERVVIYDPNNLDRLKSRYIGAVLKPGYLGEPDEEGFASFTCVDNYMDGYDADVYIRVKADESGTIRDIAEPYAEITSEGVPYEVLVDLQGICDELDYACGLDS